LLIEEVILAKGHPNITGRHKTTIEVTRETEISIRADCVIGIRANKAVVDLCPELKRHLLSGGQIEVIILVGSERFSFTAYGSPKLKLSSDREIVFRKSSYVDDRTIAIRSTAAAKDVPRSMINLLRRGEDITIKIRALC